MAAIRISTGPVRHSDGGRPRFRQERFRRRLWAGRHDEHMFARDSDVTADFVAVSMRLRPWVNRLSARLLISRRGFESLRAHPPFDHPPISTLEPRSAARIARSPHGLSWTHHDSQVGRGRGGLLLGCLRWPLRRQRERRSLGWTLHRPLNLPRVGPTERCPVSKVDKRVDWPSLNIFGSSGVGRRPRVSRTGGIRVATSRPNRSRVEAPGTPRRSSGTSARTTRTGSSSAGGGSTRPESSASTTTAAVHANSESAGAMGSPGTASRKEPAVSPPASSSVGPVASAFRSTATASAER